MIKNFKIFENNEYSKYILGLPSGQIIDIAYKNIEELKESNFIKYNKTYHLYAFKDEDYLRIMRYLKKEIKMDHKDISYFLLDIGLMKDQFIIYSDLTVDTMAPVNISYMNLKKIPFKFNRCTSDFICSFNSLETLDNSPYTVHGNFNCSHNNLIDLTGGPTQVSKSYNCSHNKISSLIGSPVSVGDFNCSYNFISDFKYLPRISGNLIKNNNMLK